MIMELVQNCSFVLKTESQQSRLRRLKTTSTGSVLAPLLFNIYMYDLPNTTARKYSYADDLSIMHTACSWQEAEEVLNQNMARLSDYLRKWRLKLSERKTVLASLHPNNKEAKHETNKDQWLLSITPRDSNLPWCEVGQDTHIPPIFGKLAHEINITHPTLEVHCWYWVGC